MKRTLTGHAEADVLFHCAGRKLNNAKKLTHVLLVNRMYHGLWKLVQLIVVSAVCLLFFFMPKRLTHDALSQLS